MSSAVPVLCVGALAFWDTTFSGLVPCRVVGILPRDTTAHAETRPSSEHTVTFEVTQDHGPYKRGEQLTSWSLHVAPRKAIKRTQYSTYILPYTVQS